MPVFCSSLGIFCLLLFLIVSRANPASVCVWQNTEKTPIEIAAENLNQELFNILAPLMDGTEALKNSTDIINKKKVEKINDKIEDEIDDHFKTPLESPSSEFKELLSSAPADLVGGT